jgi:hypothetical protein
VLGAYAPLLYEAWKWGPMSPERVSSARSSSAPDMIDAERRCEHQDRPENGDTTGFLERLIVFIEKQVYAKNLAEYGGLFHGLGVDGESFTRLRKNMIGLSERPFCLLHADLHRKNLVTDAQGRLWTIDWEMAMPAPARLQRAQSVFTDVIRVSLSLSPNDGTGFNWVALPLAARKLGLQN